MSNTGLPLDLGSSAQLGPVEALKFFCSRHLPAEAWLDSEALFDAAAAEVERLRGLLREARATLYLDPQYQAMAVLPDKYGPT